MLSGISSTRFGTPQPGWGERPQAPSDPVKVALSGEPKSESPAGHKPGALKELSPSDQRKVEALKQRDQEVRRHEQAHMAAAGSLARGGPTYEYQVGPDGKRYAISGEVRIDLSPGRTPEATIAKARVIRSAALAPAEPSGADPAVAAQAAKMEAEARQQLNQTGAGGEVQTSEMAVGRTSSAQSSNETASAKKSPEIPPVPSSQVNAVYHGSLQCKCHQILPGAMADLAV